MSRPISLGLELVVVEKGNRQSLLDALATIGQCDNDFCGVNGEEYCWDGVIASGYSSNCEYLLDKVKDIESDERLISAFFNEWMRMESGYYCNHTFKFVLDDGYVVAIAFALMY